jgi:hypothetical protein
MERNIGFPVRPIQVIVIEVRMWLHLRSGGTVLRKRPQGCPRLSGCRLNNSVHFIKGDAYDLYVSEEHLHQTLGGEMASLFRLIHLLLLEMP